MKIVLVESRVFVQPLNESILKHMEMPASWPFTNTGHVPASINRKMTIRVILEKKKRTRENRLQLTMTNLDFFPFCMEKSTATHTLIEQT